MRHALFRSLLAFALFTTTIAFAAAGTDATAAAATPLNGEISLMFVGGSLSHGSCTGPVDDDAPWRDNILSALQQDYVVSAVGTQWGPTSGCFIHPDRHSEAYIGARADEIAINLQTSLPTVEGVPDAVVILAGTEDLVAGQDVASTKADIQSILGEISGAYPNAIQLVASLPATTGIDPTALNLEIADLATTNGGVLLDFNTGIGASELVADGDHFNSAGAQIVSDRAVTAIVSALQPTAMGSVDISSVAASSWGLGTKGVSNTIGAWNARGWALEQIDNTIYVGGNFTDVTNGSIVGQQAYLAAFDADTGEWQSWFRPLVDKPIFALQKWTDAAGKDWLFVGGELGGTSGRYNGAVAGALVKVDPATGDIDPNWTTVIDDLTFRHVRDVKLEADGMLYVVGNFETASDPVQSHTVRGALRLDPDTGVIDPAWLPQLNQPSAPDGAGTGWGVSRSHTQGITYIAGFFRNVNGDLNTRGFAGVDDTGAVVINRFPLLPFNGCSGAQYCHQLYDVQATPGGNVFVVGVEHSMFTFSESPLELIYHNYTGCNPYRPENEFTDSDGSPSVCFGRNWYGGEFQEIELVGDRLYASHHGWTDHYGSAGVLPDPDTTNFDNINFPNGLPFLRHANPFDWPYDVASSTVSAVGAYNPDTAERIPEFRPKLTGTAGGFALHEATDGCFWMAGGIDSYNPSPGVHTPARDLVRLCPYAGAGSNGPIGISAPPAPLSCEALKSGPDVTITWSTEQAGKADLIRLERSTDGGTSWGSQGTRPYLDGSTTQPFVSGSLFRVSNHYEAGQFSEPVNCSTNIITTLDAPASCLAIFDFASNPNDSSTVSWDAVTDAERYVVERSRDAGPFGFQTSTTDLTFSQTLPPGSTWAYTVEAVNDTFVLRSDPTPCIEETSPPPRLTPLSQTCVVYSSQDALGVLGGTFDAGELRQVQVAGTLTDQGGAPSCIPASATAAVLRISAIDPLDSGNLRMRPAGVVTSGGVVNYTNNGLNNANTVTIPLSTGGAVDIQANGSTVGPASTDVRLVVVGYYDDSSNLTYTALNSCAVVDSRVGDDTFDGPNDDGFWPVGSDFPDVDVVGTFAAGQGGQNGITDCGVPATATAVFVNVVAIQPTGGSGFLSVGPGGQDPVEEANTPFAVLSSNFNNAATTVVPLEGGETIAIDIDGSLGAAAKVRVIILGYYSPDVSGLDFVALPSCAAFDSRFGSNGFAGTRTSGAANATIYQLTGALPSDQGGGIADCGIPAGAQAVLVNVVAIQAQQSGNFRMSEAGVAPQGGVVNFNDLAPALTNSNVVAIPLSASGQIQLEANGGNVVDGTPLAHARGIVLGYFG